MEFYAVGSVYFFRRSDIKVRKQVSTRRMFVEDPESLTRNRVILGADAAAVMEDESHANGWFRDGQRRRRPVFRTRVIAGTVLFTSQVFNFIREPVDFIGELTIAVAVITCCWRRRLIIVITRVVRIGVIRVRGIIRIKRSKPEPESHSEAVPEEGPAPKASAVENKRPAERTEAERPADENMSAGRECAHGYRS